MTTRRAALLFTCSLAVPSLALAQAAAYPDRAVHFVAAFPAGGGVDAVARVVGAALSTRWGQAVVVDNKTGAAGALGTAAVANAAKDGYTVLVTSNPSITIAAAGADKPSYDPLKDLVPVVKATVSPSIIVSAARQPYKSMADLLARAKAAPHTLSFATAGQGSTQHLEMEIVKDLLGLDMVHVPYRGTAVFMTDVLSGQVDIGVPAIPASAKYVQAGSLTGLAVLSAARSATLPGVPTLREATGANFDGIPSWFGFFLPSGTPRGVADKLERDVLEALQRPEVRSRLVALGMDVVAQGSDEFRKANEAEAALISDVMRRKGISVK